MKFVIGLGNPGSQYSGTRHNVGFEVVEALVQNLLVETARNAKFSLNKKLHSEIIKVGDLILAKPQTFMNRSGQAVRAILDYYGGEPPDPHFNLFVIHDDLDLELGTYKIQLGKGPKIHYGLLSIYEHLGTNQFWHVRVGVDGRGKDRLIPGGNYVLNKFLPAEKEIIKENTAKIFLELKELITTGNA